MLNSNIPQPPILEVFLLLTSLPLCATFKNNVFILRTISLPLVKPWKQISKDRISIMRNKKKCICIVSDSLFHIPGSNARLVLVRFNLGCRSLCFVICRFNFLRRKQIHKASNPNCLYSVHRGCHNEIHKILLSYLFLLLKSCMNMIFFV